MHTQASPANQFYFQLIYIEDAADLCQDQFELGVATPALPELEIVFLINSSNGRFQYIKNTFFSGKFHNEGGGSTPIPELLF